MEIRKKTNLQNMKTASAKYKRAIKRGRAVDFDRCAYCQRPFDPAKSGEMKGTIDHIVPKKFGGTNFLENMVPACHNCNTAKASFSLTQFEQKLYMLYKGLRPPCFRFDPFCVDLIPVIILNIQTLKGRPHVAQFEKDSPAMRTHQKMIRIEEEKRNAMANKFPSVFKDRPDIFIDATDCTPNFHEEYIAKHPQTTKG